MQPHLRVLGRDPLSQDPAHPGEHVVVLVGLAHPPRELGEDLVGRCALAVDDPVREALGPGADRLERDRDDRGRGDRQRQVLRVAGSDDRADPDDDRHVHHGDERGERSVEQRLADDDVEVVQVEPQDRDRDRHRKHEVGGPAEHRPQKRLIPGGRAEDEQDDRERQAEGHPLDLLAFHAGRAPEPLDQREDREAEQHGQRDRDERVERHRVEGRDVERIADADVVAGAAQQTLTEEQVESDDRDERHAAPQERAPSRRRQTPVRKEQRDQEQRREEAQEPAEVRREPRDRDHRSLVPLRDGPRREVTRRRAGHHDQRADEEQEPDPVPGIARHARRVPRRRTS